MSKNQETTTALAFAAFGLLLLALAVYQCHSLVQMIEDNLDYASTLLTLADGQTLPVPPPERFLGAGLLGMLFPVVASGFGGLLMLMGIYGLYRS